MANPFSPQHPAQPEYFAGRKAETDYFRETALNSAMLKPPAPLNYAILGTWGLGKTSLLYELKQIAVNEMRKDAKCACIHYSLSPQSCRDWRTFSTDFLRTVNSTLNATSNLQSKIKSELNKWQLTLNFGVLGAQRAGTSEMTRAPDMLGSLRDLWKKHLQPAGIDVVFVLLDDFHYFPIAAEDSAYLSLRSLFQELVNQKCNYSLVVTAHAGLFAEIADLAEPVLRFFKRFDLRPFTFEDAREAIDKRLEVARMNLKLDDDVVQAIVDRTGGHPYIFMFTMFELIMKLKEMRRIDFVSFQKAWGSIENDISETILLQKFLGASEKERELLLRIGESGTNEFSPADFKSVRGINELCSRLEDKEFLIKIGRGKYTLFHPLFARYLKKKAGS